MTGTEILRILYINIFLFIIPFTSNSQDTTSFTCNLPTENSILFNTSKLVNTFLLTCTSEFDYQIFGGRLRINQLYRGITLNTSSSASRDDENLKIIYDYPIHELVNFVTEQNWIYSSDSRSIGLNKLERLNIASGFSYNYLTDSFLELKAGVENNNQLGFNSIGPMVNIKSSLNNFSLEGYNIHYNINGEYQKLELSRNNSNLDINTHFFRNFDDYDKFNIDFNYRLFNRDFLSPTILSGWNLYSVESRLENRLMVASKVDFAITDEISGLMGLSYQNVKVGRFFKNYISDYKMSGVHRSLDEMQIGLNADGKLNLSFLKIIAGLSFEIRTEKNIVENKYQIDNNDFNEINKIESLRDNNSYRTRFYNSVDWLLSNKDNLKFDYSVSIYQYDTPGKDNYDDRDEFSTLINTSYIHKFNYEFTASIYTEIQLYHQVFLKSQRSALNNWNRIFRLGSAFIWRTKLFEVKPEFDILVNYTVYDFEEISPGVRSFSYRQIAYKDSISLYLGKMLSLQSNINLRYFERGILFWRTFSESPQSSSIEKFIKTMLVTGFSKSAVSIGGGIRYYGLTQKSLTGTVSGLGDMGYYQVSIAPETEIKITFSSGSYLSLNGWYEFQNINNIDYRQIPNFFLTTKIVL